MKTAQEWTKEEIFQLKETAQDGEWWEVIERIQADALRHAAGILKAYCEPCETDWGKAYNDIQTETKLLEDFGIAP